MGYNPDNDFDDLPEEDDDVLWNSGQKKPHRMDWDDEDDEWGDSWDDD